MRDEGASYKEIGAAVGRPPKLVRYWLDDSARGAILAERKTTRGELSRYRHLESTDSHHARQPRRFLAEGETKAAAINAFARGEITAAAMMAQSTIGAPASTGPVR
jgi:hypothetical protein